MPETSADPTELGSLTEERERLRVGLARSRRALRRQLAMEALLDLVAALVIAGFVLVVADYGFRPGLPARRIVRGVTLLGIAAALVLRSLPRMKAATLDDLELAMTLDRYRPGTGQQVADVLQLPRQLDGPDPMASPPLIRLAVRRASEALGEADWRAHWNRRRTIVRGLALIGALLVPLAFARLAPVPARLSLARWLLNSKERWPQRTYLSVTGLGEGRRLVAPRDEPFAIEVRADLPGVEPSADGWIVPGRGERFGIREKPEPLVIPETVRLRERSPDGSVREAVMTSMGAGRFRHELPPSSASSTFEIVGGDDWLGPIRVTRVDRPSLQTLAIRVKDPGTPAGTFRPVDEAGQQTTFLADTEVELTLVGTEQIALTRVEVHPSAPPAVVRLDPRTFTTRWTLREATTLEIGLTSGNTGLTSRPRFLSLGLLKDREPRVTLRSQGVSGHVTPVATIPLSIAATDDLGLGAIRLKIERTTQAGEKAEPVILKGEIPIPLATEGVKAVLDHQARHDVGLRASNPAIGAVLRFQAEAEDRSARGPQVGRSGVVTVQVVSADELFYEILLRQRAERAKFVAALDAAEKLTPMLAGSPSADDLTNAGRSLHTVIRQLDQIAVRIGDSLAEMKLNEVGSPKSHRLLQEGVIDPIRALNTGPAGELRTALQALSANPRNSKGLDDARKLHVQVVARMRVILDQMSQWESFVDVVNQVAEVIKMQQDVLKATEKARETRTQEVFDAKP